MHGSACAEMCFKVSEDFSNVVAAWRAAVDIATTYIKDDRWGTVQCCA